MVAGSGTRCCGNRISKPSGDGGKKDIGLGVLHLPKAHRAMGEAFAGLSDTMSGLWVLFAAMLRFIACCSHV